MTTLDRTGHRTLTVAAWAVKAVTVAMLVFAATHSDWERFEGKAFAGRAIAYPIALLILPLVWAALGRRRPYPALADLLISLPFAVDVGGNVADAYDQLGWFDDACHFGNWAMLMGALAVSLPRTMHPATQLGLVVGLGSTTALGWEIAEYWTFIRHGTEIETAYTDTLGDMTLGTIGAAVAGMLVLRTRRHR